MTYFTSDQHFGHFNIIRLSHRPFASLDEMNETMVARWNAKVRGEEFQERHADTARSNPLELFCAEA